MASCLCYWARRRVKQAHSGASPRETTFLFVSAAGESSAQHSIPALRHAGVPSAQHCIPALCMLRPPPVALTAPAPQVLDLLMHHVTTVKLVKE